jgi:hypothetical protein
MQLGEPRRWDAADAAVRPDFVVVLSPDGGGRSSLVQRLEPLLVQALVPELSVEALDVAVLHGPAWLDQNVANTVAVRPGHEGPTGELRTVVGANGQRVATKDGRAIKQPGDVLTRDAPVHGNVHALVAEVVGHRQKFDASSIGQAVADEVHAPHLVDALGQLQRHPLRGGPLGLLALAHGQVGFAVQAIHAFVVHAGKLRAQQIVDAAVAKATARLGDLDDLAAQVFAHLVGLGWVAVTVAGEPHKAASPALGQVMQLDHLADGIALGLWG